MLNRRPQQGNTAPTGVVVDRVYTRQCLLYHPSKAGQPPHHRSSQPWRHEAMAQLTANQRSACRHRSVEPGVHTARMRSRPEGRCMEVPPLDLDTGWGENPSLGTGQRGRMDGVPATAGATLHDHESGQEEAELDADPAEGGQGRVDPPREHNTAGREGPAAGHGLAWRGWGAREPRAREHDADRRTTEQEGRCVRWEGLRRGWEHAPPPPAAGGLCPTT